MKNQVTVCCEIKSRLPEAKLFADKHGLQIANIKQANSPFLLYYKDNHVELIDRQENTAIHVDFLSGALAHRRQFGGGKGQAIAKAVGLNKYPLPLTIVDATAGLAKDAFVLACLGCSLTLLEQNPIIAELVNSAIKLAENEEDFRAIKQQGFELIQADAITYLQNLSNKPDVIYPDVIYLDPMYPERKKSAAVKKNMQILQKLLGHDASKQADEKELLDIALNTAVKRVVVKRPKGAPTLSEKKPNTCIESKTTRYDVYVLT